MTTSAREVSKGIATVSLQSQIPVLFGVLTTDTIEQAIERAGTKAGNKGYDCALSAVEMVNLLRRLGTEGAFSTALKKTPPGPVGRRCFGLGRGWGQPAWMGVQGFLTPLERAELWLPSRGPISLKK